AVGFVPAGLGGAVRLVRPSAGRLMLLGLPQLRTGLGPCPECFHSGQPVAVPDLRTAADRWPAFVAEARQIGFASVHAVPMRLRSEVIGALNLFDTRAGALHGDTIQLGQALADVATVGLLQARAINRRDPLTEQ